MWQQQLVVVPVGFSLLQSLLFWGIVMLWMHCCLLVVVRLLDDLAVKMLDVCDVELL